MTRTPAGPVLSRRRFLRAAGLTGAAFVAAPLFAACSTKPNQLLFLNWQDYIAPGTLAGYSSRYGVSVSYETYASNDELQRKMLLASAARRGGRKAKTFDLIVPSDYVVERFVSLDLLEELDHERLPNLKNLEPAFRNSGFDPGNVYTVPWATGSTGIGYDTTVFTDPPDWNVFLETAHQGKMSVLAEIRDAYAAALFSLDKDPNATSPADVNAATDRLIAMKRVIQGFDSTNYLDELARGNLVAAQAYSSDLLEAKQRNPKLDFVIPPQGGGRWVDSLAIPRGAPNPDNAYRFIDWYLTAEVSAQVANFVQVDTANAAAMPLLQADVRDNPVVFPPADVESRLVFTQDLGAAEALYVDGWERVRSA